MKTYGGVDVHGWTSALAGGEWSASRPGRFTPGERAPVIQWIERWVGPRTGFDDVERRKILPLLRLELRSLGRPARSQSLHRLCYPRLTIILKNEGNYISISFWSTRPTYPQSRNMKVSATACSDVCICTTRTQYHSLVVSKCLEISGSELDTVTSYTDYGFLWFSYVISGKC
jgi:hypothetical protein